ncbi:MAG: hypothetical protein ACYCVH_09620 [Ignavibacteriaceae bacterium]
MKKNFKKIFHFLILSYIFLSFGSCNSNNPAAPVTASSNYPVHQNIIVTIFWVGEPADSSNDFISNSQSAWDNHWLQHYGGYDDPRSRNGFYPSAFTPKENPFYFALPYNDLDTNGVRKHPALSIYWANEKSWSPNESICKNQWIKITKGNKIIYAQWEDTGPGYYDDSLYVFGTALPENQTGNKSGLDISPAVRDFLGLSDIDTVSWQFVKPSEVPDGIWNTIVTISQIDFN